MRGSRRCGHRSRGLGVMVFAVQVGAFASGGVLTVCRGWQRLICVMARASCGVSDWSWFYGTGLGPF